MKNKQKGFIGIGIMLWIIVGLAIAGSATYVAVKHKNSAKVESEQRTPTNGQASGLAGIAIDEPGVHVTSPTAAGIAIDEPGVHVTSTASVSGSQSDGWFYVPELRAKFKNVFGFTPQYKQFKIDSAPWPSIEGIEFISKEITARAQVDSKIAMCASVGRVTISNISKAEVPEGDYKAFHEVSLGDGRYLRTDSPQAPCYEEGTSKESLDILSTQGKLFAQFLDSARAY